MIALVVSIIIQIKNKVGFKQAFKKMHCKISQFLTVLLRLILFSEKEYYVNNS